jgi:hypothetical protein
MKTTPFDVVIPNSDRTAIVRTIAINVPVRIEDGIEILTPEAMELIEKTQRENMPRKPCPLCGKIEEPDQIHAVYRCEGAIKQLAEVFQKK